MAEELDDKLERAAEELEAKRAELAYWQGMLERERETRAALAKEIPVAEAQLEEQVRELERLLRLVAEAQARLGIRPN